MKKELFIEAATYALTMLFVYAALNKLFAFNFYLNDLKRSPLLSPFAWPLAILIPGLELLIAVMLLTPKYKHLGFRASFALMTVFTLYVGFIVYSDMEKPCSCGGIIRNLTWSQHLLFNVFFMLLALTAMLSIKNRSKLFTQRKAM